MTVGAAESDRVLRPSTFARRGSSQHSAPNRELLLAAFRRMTAVELPKRSCARETKYILPLTLGVALKISFPKTSRYWPTTISLLDSVSVRGGWVVAVHRIGRDRWKRGAPPGESTGHSAGDTQHDPCVRARLSGHSV